MKKNNIFTIVLSLLVSISIWSQTAGTLTCTFTPVAHTGSYGTKSVLAVWIQTSTGTFVKTKMRYVGTGTDDHLPTWGGNAGCANPTAVAATTGCNVTDATTGATLSSYTTKSFTWDGKNVSGTVNGTTVADGAYRVAIEETWTHGTSGTAVRYLNFTKGATADHQTPANDANFTNITLDWVPTAMSVDENIAQQPKVEIFPNPSNGIFTLDIQSSIKTLNVYNVLGQQVYTEEFTNDTTGTTKTLDFSDWNAGVYFVKVSNDKSNSTDLEIMIQK